MQACIRWGKANIQEANETRGLAWVSTEEDTADVSLEAAALSTMGMIGPSSPRFHPHAHECASTHTHPGAARRNAQETRGAIQPSANSSQPLPKEPQRQSRQTPTPKLYASEAVAAEDHGILLSGSAKNLLDNTTWHRTGHVLPNQTASVFFKEAKGHEYDRETPKASGNVLKTENCFLKMESS